jgi:hypothetical protein
MAKYFSEVIKPIVVTSKGLSEMAETIITAIKDRKKTTTYFWPVGYDSENIWYITAGWMDGFDKEADGDTERLCMKVAYRTRNSIMYDYDFDMIMPVDSDSSEVWDTEISTNRCTTSVTILEDLCSLMNSFNHMVKVSREENAKMVAVA